VRQAGAWLCRYCTGVAHIRSVTCKMATPAQQPRITRLPLILCRGTFRRQEEKGLAYVDMAWLNPSKPGGGLPDEPTYDMILTVDAVHDMARPDVVLPLVRKVRSTHPSFCCRPRPLDMGGHAVESLAAGSVRLLSLRRCIGLCSAGVEAGRGLFGFRHARPRNAGGELQRPECRDAGADPLRLLRPHLPAVRYPSWLQCFLQFDPSKC